MLKWELKKFEELDGASVYAILALRCEVFVVEQACVYQDIDGYDRDAVHLLGWQEREGKRMLAAYARIFGPDNKYPEPSLGRVATSPAVRGTGAGRALVAEALAYADRTWPGRGVRISAQRYLEKFYGSFGFAVCSEPYDEDGIPHIEMLRR